MVSPQVPLTDVPDGEQRESGSWRKKRLEQTPPQLPSGYNLLDHCLRFFRTQHLSWEGRPITTASLKPYSLQTSLAWFLTLLILQWVPSRSLTGRPSAHLSDLALLPPAHSRRCSPHLPALLSSWLLRSLPSTFLDNSNSGSGPLHAVTKW